MMMIYFLLIISLLLLCFHLFVHYSKFGRAINKIPGVPVVPLFGNLLVFAIPSEKVWPKLRELFDKYYPTLRLWTGPVPAVCIRHPDDLKILLSCKKNIGKCDSVYGNIRRYMNDGILTSTGQIWHHRRKLLNQAFTPNLLEIYMGKINNRADKLVTELRSRGDIIIDNISPIFLKFALAAICDTVMGFDTDTMPAEREKTFRDAITEFSDLTLYRVCRPYLRDFMMPFVPVGRRLAKITKIIDSFRKEITEKRRKYHASVGEEIFKNCIDGIDRDTDSDGRTGFKKKLAVLDLLLLAEKEGLIDNDGILGEVFIIMSAGFETTGMAIAFLLTLLAENKEHQDLVRTEIREVLGDDRCITINHIKKMEYLDRCVKESLRLFPTAPHSGRLISEKIKLSKYTLPVGTVVIMSYYDLHRDPHFWPDPDRFDPDRFLPKHVKIRHPFAYLPFSAGLRNCIGQKFSMAEMKCVAAHILHNFYLEPIDKTADFKPGLKITLALDYIHMKFIRIDRD